MNIVSDKQTLNKHNKIMLKSTLEKLKERLEDKQFRKEFFDLFKDYLDVNNCDSNAHYFKILKLLENAGFSREEAEEFFKDIRVHSKKTIIEISNSKS